MSNKHKLDTSFMTMMRTLVRETNVVKNLAEKRKNPMTISQEPTLLDFCLVVESYVQGLHSRKDPNDSMRKKHIVIKTKVLSDVMGVVKEWSVFVPPDIVLASNFYYCH